MTQNILFIHPSQKILNKKDNLYTNESLTPSLGLATVAAWCRKHNFGVQILDLRLPHHTAGDIAGYIRKFNPLFVGITAFTCEIIQAAATAKIIKQEFPGLTVAIGGPHVSVVPQETLEEFGDFDIAVVGEGEETVKDLASSLGNGIKDSLEDVPGIALRVRGEVKINPQRKAIENINALPMPAWDLFELEHYHKLFVISASRGCPYSCYFCNPNYLGRALRIRDPLRVVDEIEELVNKFNAKKIQFGDAALSILGEKTVLLCDEIIRRGLDKKIEWDCETRADTINPKLLNKMKQAGCRWIALGVETGNEKILKEVVRKNETKAQIKEAVKLIRQAGIKIRCFFVLGHYTETANNIKETIKFALQLNPDALAFGLMVPNPGTEIRRIAQNNKSGLRILNNNWEHYNQFDYDCFESELLPLGDLKKWRSHAYFKFYLHHPVKAARLFMDTSGYSYKSNNVLKLAFMLLKNSLKVK